MTVMAKTSRTGGCGCGGGGGGSCGGESCGGADSATCPPGSLARPRFFAGQLLTQEDLQLIVDYVVGKNRLHNRFLFGEGVVCGLTVTCPPCDGGQVSVAPGYAMDCCGNDIYLPCRKELDIAGLIRELRLRTLDAGDCGDPCQVQRCARSDDEGAGAPESEGGPDGAAPAAGKPAPANQAKGSANSSTFHYCLYLKYRESEVEPVAPYVSDAGCGAIACEPTRICEGARFELRCTKKPAVEDILGRLKACIGDLATAAAVAQKSQVGSAQAAILREHAALAAERESRLDAADVKAMQDSSAALESASFEQTMDEASVRRHLANYELLSKGVARANRLEPQEAPENLKPVLEKAKKTLAATRDDLARLAARVLLEPLARDAAHELFELSDRYALSKSKAGLDSVEAKLFRSGALVSSKLLARMRLDAAQVKVFLHERLSSSAGITSCDLLERLRAVRLGDDDEVSFAGVNRAYRSSEELARILLEYLRDCFCLALNPPCAPCDDPAILLACLDVRDCRVVDVCNMGRRFVLSPANLRYFLPPIGALGKLFDFLCCEFELDAPAETLSKPSERPALETKTSVFRASAAPTLDTASFDSDVKLGVGAVGLELADVEAFVRLASNLGVLGLRQVPQVGDFGRSAARGFGALTSERDRSGADLDALRDDLKHEVAVSIAAEREATLRVAATGAAKTVKEEVQAALTDDALERRLGDVKVVRELLAENRNLKAELKKLSDTVKKLER